jgi:hypothetical protein
MTQIQHYTAACVGRAYDLKHMRPVRLTDPKPCRKSTNSEPGGRSRRLSASISSNMEKQGQERYSVCSVKRGSGFSPLSYKTRAMDRCNRPTGGAEVGLSPSGVCSGGLSWGTNGTQGRLGRTWPSEARSASAIVGCSRVLGFQASMQARRPSLHC